MTDPRPRTSLLLPALAALYVGVRVAFLTRWDLWFDELFGVELGHLGWSELLARAAMDQTNPPLFYLMIKGWMEVGGTSPWWLHLLPFLCALLGLWALLRLLEILKLEGDTRSVVLALAALSPMLVFYSVELRAYALLFALGTAATAECAALVLNEDERPGPLLRLALWNLLLPFTHYFGWTVIAAEWGAFLLFAPKQVRTRLIVTLPAFVAFVPWAFEVVEAVREVAAFAPTISWIPRPGIVAVLGAPGFLVSTAGGTFDLVAGALALVAISYGAARGTPETRRTRIFLALFVVIPVLGTFAASWLAPRSFWVPRNLIGAAAPTLILLTFALTRDRWRLATSAALLCCLVGLFVGGGPARKQQWRAITARLTTTDAGRLPVYAYEPYIVLPLRYYAEHEGRPLDVKFLTVADSLAGREGWVVVRPRYWPGRREGGAAYLTTHGMRVTDSAATEPPWERVESWRWAKD